MKRQGDSLDALRELLGPMGVRPPRRRRKASTVARLEAHPDLGRPRYRASCAAVAWSMATGENYQQTMDRMVAAGVMARRGAVARSQPLDDWLEAQGAEQVYSRVQARRVNARAADDGAQPVP